MKDFIDKLKTEVASVVFGKPILKVALFGSMAEGKSTELSDIDIVMDVDYSKGFSYFDLLEIQEHLENRLDRKVDLLTRRSISKHILPYIKEINIYEA